MSALVRVLLAGVVASAIWLVAPASPVAAQAVAEAQPHVGPVLIKRTATVQSWALPDGRILTRRSLPASRYSNGWTHMLSSHPRTARWKPTSPMGVGFNRVAKRVSRSSFRFYTAWLAGKTVLSAEFNLRQVRAATCSVRATDLYRTKTITRTTSWSTQPTRLGLQGTSFSTAGCEGNTRMIGFDIRKGMRAIAREGAAYGTFMLRARNETSATNFKRFDDEYANIDLTYISRPHAPTGMAVRSQSGFKTYPCGGPDSPTVVGSDSVYVMTTLRSPDGNSAHLRAVWTTSHNGTATVKVDEITQPSGSWSERLIRLEDGETYAVRVKTRDYVWDGSGRYVEGPYESDLYGRGGQWCWFTVDLFGG